MYVIKCLFLNEITLKNCFLNYNLLLQSEYRNGMHLECSPKCSHVSTMIAQSNSRQFFMDFMVTSSHFF